MSEQDKFEAFMQKVSRTPLPNQPMAQIRLCAREIALGTLEKLWPMHDIVNNQVYHEYRRRRWNDAPPDPQLMVQLGYFSNSRGLTIEGLALKLVEEVEPAEIFISYRRKESSAFALLILARLKDFDLHAFLDMSIRPGDNWHAYIKEQIQQRDYFVLLLGKETLKSDVVKQEILWAIEAGAEIIPIWHNGFEFKPEEIDVSPEIQKVLGSNHSIHVLEESALEYNKAIVELLNRFGVSP